MGSASTVPLAAQHTNATGFDKNMETQLLLSLTGEEDKINQAITRALEEAMRCPLEQLVNDVQHVAGQLKTHAGKRDAEVVKELAYQLMESAIMLYLAV